MSLLDKWLRSGSPAQEDAGEEPQDAPFRDQTIQAIKPRVMRNFAYEIEALLEQGVPGAPGPPGPSGPADPASVAYRHVQTTPLTTWTITHPLGFRPNVMLVDSSGRMVWPDEVQYVSDTTVQVNFSAAVAGEAYCT